MYVFFLSSRSAAVYYPNFCTKIVDECQEFSCFQGISGDVWNTLQKVLNFTYTIHKNKAWGSKENNLWTGMIGN